MYFDPLGETESDNTVFTLTVRCPRRFRYLPDFLTRTSVRYPKNRQVYTIPPDDADPNLNCSKEKHLSTKTITIKSPMLPAELRCEHLQNAKVCGEECYVMEGIGFWHCEIFMGKRVRAT
jgi:hypothetical protein